MRILLTPDQTELINELVQETEQPVVVFMGDNGHMQIGVLEEMPENIDWYFEPVPAEEAEKLGTTSND